MIPPPLEFLLVVVLSGYSIFAVYRTANRGAQIHPLTWATAMGVIFTIVFWGLLGTIGASFKSEADRSQYVLGPYAGTIAFAALILAVVLGAHQGTRALEGRSGDFTLRIVSFWRGLQARWQSRNFH